MDILGALGFTCDRNGVTYFAELVPVDKPNGDHHRLPLDNSPRIDSAHPCKGNAYGKSNKDRNFRVASDGGTANGATGPSPRLTAPNSAKATLKENPVGIIRPGVDADDESAYDAAKFLLAPMYYLSKWLHP